MQQDIFPTSEGQRFFFQKVPLCAIDDSFSLALALSSLDVPYILNIVTEGCRSFIISFSPPKNSRFAMYHPRMVLAKFCIE